MPKLRGGDSPDEDKSVHDARLLIPTLKDFFSAHPLINPKTFLGDAAFDSVKLYRRLLSGDAFGTDADGDGTHFQKAFIPLNSRAGLENKDYVINDDGVPCCPNDPSLPMKPEGTRKLGSGVTRYKFSCPKSDGKKTLPLGDTIVSAALKTPVLLLPAEEWFTSILKKT